MLVITENTIVSVGYWGRVREGTPGRIVDIDVLGGHAVAFDNGETARARAEELARISSAGPLGGPSPRWWATTDDRSGQPRTPQHPPGGSVVVRGLLAVPLVIVLAYALFQMA